MIRVLVAASLLGSVAAGALAYRRSEPGATRSEERLDAQAVPVDERPAALVFTSPWCIACQQVPERLAGALDVSQEELRAGEAPVAFASLDVREHPILVEQLDVQRTPTIAGVDAEDRVAFLLEEAPSEDQLAQELAGLQRGAAG